MKDNQYVISVFCHPIWRQHKAAYDVTLLNNLYVLARTVLTSLEQGSGPAEAISSQARYKDKVTSVQSAAKFCV